MRNVGALGEAVVRLAPREGHLRAAPRSQNCLVSLGKGSMSGGRVEVTMATVAAVKQAPEISDSTAWQQVGSCVTVLYRASSVNFVEAFWAKLELSEKCT